MHKEKKEELPNKASKHTTSLVGISHNRNKTKEVRRNISPTQPREPETPHVQPIQSDKTKGPPPATTMPRRQAHHGLPIRHPVEERAVAPTTAKGDRLHPIKIILRDSIDTVALIEKKLNIKNFHIKRIHAGKHVLFLQNLTDYKEAKEILISANTALYTYTPKSEEHHTYFLKGLDNSYTESEILKDLQALQMYDIQFTKVSRFSTRRSKQNNILLSIHIVQISSQSNSSNLLKINRVNYFRIKWEKIKKKTI
jgi:hypothetical protein